MLPYSDNVLIFRDTLKMIDRDKDLLKAVSHSRLMSDVYYEDEYPSYKKPYDDNKKTVVSVEKGRAFEIAKKYSKDDAKISVLNFANAFHPGGGVEEGCTAQEESLCRLSTLYPVLIDKWVVKSFYERNKKMFDDRASDTLIYSPDIVVLKEDTLKNPKALKKEDRFNVDVITMAAPDLRRIYDMESTELYAIHFKRAMHMLTVAASKNVDILILGAFGCGAFLNDPEIVAYAYYHAISAFPNMFDKIVFAIYDSGNSANFKIFNAIIGGYRNG